MKKINICLTTSIDCRLNKLTIYFDCFRVLQLYLTITFNLSLFQQANKTVLLSFSRIMLYMYCFFTNSTQFTTQALFHGAEFFFSILKIKNNQIIMSVDAQLYGMAKIFLADAVT